MNAVATAAVIKPAKKAPSFNVKKAMVSRSDIINFPHDIIEIEDGFNVRNFESPEVLEHIDGLAVSISEVGLRRPLTVRRIGDRLALVDGECRLRAIRRAISVYGADIASVPTILVERNKNDADAVLSIITENSGLPLSPSEKAEVVSRLSNFGWTNVQIAKKTGMTPSRISQLLGFAGMPEKMKSMVREGVISATSAFDVYRSTGMDGAAALAIIETAAPSSSGEGQVTAGAAPQPKVRLTPRSLSGGVTPKKEMATIVDGASVEFEEDTNTVTMTLTGEDYDRLCELLKINPKAA